MTTLNQEVATSTMLPTISKPFIEANTETISFEEMRDDCVIPVFSRDNERTISHQEFIGSVQDALVQVYPNFDAPEIRVSHKATGRIPEAIHKSKNELLPNEITKYYQRMAFIIRIPEITDVINGNKLQLTIGGVRAYDLENLGGKKSLEKFKFFIGFQNMVCCNLCVSTDGFLSQLKCSTIEELRDNVLKVIHNYEADKHLAGMKELVNYDLTEHEFAQLIGKSRLYQHLPKEMKKDIPALDFNDSHFSIMAKDYYTDHAFSKMQDGNINLWNVYNLFTQANKSSYIDTIFDRSLNAYELSRGLARTLDGSPEYEWFLK